MDEADEGVIWYGSESLRSLLVPVGDVQPFEGNARRVDVALMAASLSRFGQLKPIVTTPDGTIAAGKHLWQAAAERLGWTHVAVAQAANLGDEGEALGYLIADNHMSDVAGYDPVAQAQLLDGWKILADEDDERALLSMGWLTRADFEHDLEQWKKRAVREGPPDAWPGFDEGIEVAFCCIGCAFRWSGGMPATAAA